MPILHKPIGHNEKFTLVLLNNGFNNFLMQSGMKLYKTMAVWERKENN